MSGQAGNDGALQFAFSDGLQFDTAPSVVVVRDGAHPSVGKTML